MAPTAENSITQGHGYSPLAVPPPASPNSGRRSSLASLPPPPAFLAASMPGPPTGFSSMAARRFSGRQSSTGQGGLPSGLVTTGPAGPLNTRLSVTSAVAAKHGQIMQVQAQVETEVSRGMGAWVVTVGYNGSHDRA